MSTVASVAAFTFLLAAGGPPEPPPDLRAWVEYAREAVDAGPACPPGRSCVHLQRIEFRGRTPRGEVRATFSGDNLGVEPQPVTLLRPAATFSVTATRWSRGRGVVRLDGDAWMARVQPGAFTVELQLTFEPAPSVPLQLGSRVAHVVDRLDEGSLAFDESSDRHEGVLYLQSAARVTEKKQPVTVSATREFKFGSVVTFTYQFSVSGLREQARVELPLLGGETFEGLEPPIPYTANDTALVVTLTPGATSVRALGHFPERPQELKKPADLQFEYWLFSSDQRHPVELATSGVEIDPGEVPGLTPEARSRAYFLVEEQSLSINPLDVTVDKGRQGSGTASVVYTQGRADHWVGTLALTSTSAPESDRILVPTPQPPHYAESGGEPVRLFSDEETLSLRVVTADDRLQPIRVQWREPLGTNAILSSVRLEMPGQSLHLDEQSVAVGLLPGYVPMAVLGAQHASGHLLDGLHVYAVLIALLGIALARTGRFPIWGTVVTAILLAGLYTVDDFPRGSLLTLLAACAIIVRLPTASITNLREHRVLFGFLSLVWVVILAITIIWSVVYVKDRVFSALHPWSDAESGPSVSFEPVAMAPPAAPMPSDYDEYGEYDAPEEEAPVAKKVAPGRGGKGDDRTLDRRREWKQLAQQQDVSNLSGLLRSQKAAPRATEKTIRPVAFDTPGLPQNRVEYGFGSLLPGDGASARVLLAGPWLRGLWMFAECFGLGAILALLIVRARRWWTGQEVQP